MLEVLEPLRAYKRVLLAVSGGSDSVALMKMMQQWGQVDYVVATIDHNLRVGSREECEKVVGWSGGKATILTWQGEKPTTGIQNAAREARYELLAHHAKEVGAEAIVTAHTLNDQAETVMMRLFKGSSPSGLAGMNMVSEKRGLPVIRPFLWLSRQDLRDYLTSINQQYIDDPSNDNEKYTRVRFRKMMPMLETEGLTIERLGKFAARQNMHNEAIDFYATELMDEIKTNAKPLLNAPFITVLKLFSKLIAENGDLEIPERLEKLEELVVGVLEALASGEAFHATLRGAKVTITLNGVLRIVKQPPRS